MKNPLWFLEVRGKLDPVYGKAFAAGNLLRRKGQPRPPGCAGRRGVGAWNMSSGRSSKSKFCRQVLLAGGLLSRREWT